MSQDKDPNEGEGGRTAARRYDRKAEQFVAEGKVPDAASQARTYVDRDPAGAAKAERTARSRPTGGRWASVDDLVAKGRTVLERARRVVAALRGRR